LVEGGADLGRRHRQFGEAAVDRAVDRVGDRRHRRHDVDFADALGAVGVRRVRDLDEDRLDHRHVGRDRHPVVEEAGVVEPAIAIVDVFLVERPADALRDAALDLALDIGGVDRLADILRCDKAQDRHLAGLGIDLDIAELRRETGRHAAGIEGGGGGDRPAGSAFFAANSLNDTGKKSPTLLLAGFADSRMGFVILWPRSLLPAGEDKFLTGVVITLES
jgi:hypothetical protein